MSSKAAICSMAVTSRNERTTPRKGKTRLVLDSSPAAILGGHAKEAGGSSRLEISERHDEPVFEHAIFNLQLGASVQRSRHYAFERHAAEPFLAQAGLDRSGWADCLMPCQHKRGLPRRIRLQLGREGGIASGSRQRAVAHRVRDEFMQRKTDMQGGIRVEPRPLALQANGGARCCAVARHLLQDEVAEIRAAPVGRGDKILRRGQRLEPAAESRDELLDS